MLLETPHLHRERIAVLGQTENGKTKAWLDIMKATESNFYVLDTDIVVPAMLDGKEYKNIDNSRLDIRHPLDWPEWVNPIKKWEVNATKDDWLVIDFFHPSWDAVQRYWIESIHGEDPEDYFAQARKQFEVDEDKKVFNPISGNMDWPYIKKMYYSWTNRLRRWPGHLYLTMASKSIVTEGMFADDKQIIREFGDFGVRPEGEKTTPFFPFTMLLFFKDAKGHKFSSMKDKEREKKLNQAWSNFGMDYLFKVAGWKPIGDEEDE